jgi:hypothetical protein
MLLAAPVGAGAPARDLQFRIVVSLPERTACVAGTGLRLAPGDSPTLIPLDDSQPIAVRDHEAHSRVFPEHGKPLWLEYDDVPWETESDCTDEDFVAAPIK